MINAIKNERRIRKIWDFVSSQVTSGCTCDKCRLGLKVMNIIFYEVSTEEEIANTELTGGKNE